MSRPRRKSRGLRARSCSGHRPWSRGWIHARARWQRIPIRFRRRRFSGHGRACRGCRRSRRTRRLRGCMPLCSMCGRLTGSRRRSLRRRCRWARLRSPLWSNRARRWNRRTNGWLGHNWDGRWRNLGRLSRRRDYRLRNYGRRRRSRRHWFRLDCCCQRWRYRPARLGYYRSGRRCNGTGGSRRRGSSNYSRLQARRPGSRVLR